MNEEMLHYSTLKRLSLKAAAVNAIFRTLQPARKCFSDISLNSTAAERFVRENTEITRNHLTPEIQLHLITPQCPLWHSNGEHFPIADPYWAFYWPGGQALTRYILNNKEVFRQKTVLDVGSGCGASAIACSMSDAANVTANDICPVAGQVIAMNCKLNNTRYINVDERNLIDTCDESWDIILFGDMFYDQEFTNHISQWMQTLHEHGKTIFIGDPGRLYFTKHELKKTLQNVFTVDLPMECQWENNGLTQGRVWQYS